MTERQSIRLAEEMRGAPATVASLKQDLAALGVAPGMTLLVHSSMSRMGWVCGGPQAVIEAFLESVMLEGTLVMPSFSSEVGDPSTWIDPYVPQHWWQTIREHLPAYDPALTPTREMGAIAESFRQLPGALRSPHPATSFAAYGAKADEITANHSMEFGLGEGSPLARIYDLDGYVLLLGVGQLSNAAIALAENRSEWLSKEIITCAAPVHVAHERRWVTYEELEFNTIDYPKIGESYAAQGEVSRGKVACADAILMPIRGLVDYAMEWIAENRR